jgi:hypothetical protein
LKYKNNRQLRRTHDKKERIKTFVNSKIIIFTVKGAADFFRQLNGGNIGTAGFSALAQM